VNLLARCDAIDVGLHVAPGSAQLAYLDPPFGIGSSFGARTPDGKGGASWRAQGAVAYSDRWPSIHAYLEWLEPRIAAVRECLASDGTMWLHLDHRAVHESKGVCDRVFGSTAFLGEVIWAPGNGTRGARRGPGTTHQTLLLYAAGRDFVWNARDPDLREPFAATSLSMHFTKQDAEGRWYRERTLAGRTYRYYADEGRAIGSIWTDCPAMTANTPLRRESTGYPTQKPAKLLERIVRASSREGARVIDPFCGSGTALAAAAKLGRTFSGSDIGALAIETATRRLEAQGAAFELRVPSSEQRCPTEKRASSHSS
jgi:site-specific DNA-methyltransferase (adenine-specific)